MTNNPLNEHKQKISVSNPIPNPGVNIGVDLEDTFIKKIAEAGVSSQLDIAKIESFTQVSNNREIIMELLDTMGEDVTIAAALEVYAEDITEANDDGQIVWVSANDPKISSYVTFLLDTMNVDKHIYKWALSLCKYGDLYLRLYRTSDYEEDDLFDKPKNTLNEDVIVKTYSNSDKYSHYVEMVPNPAEMFELTKYGKTYAYIKANTFAQAKKEDSMYTITNYRYSFNKQDVEVYEPTAFVHACLEDNTCRVPEEIEIFNNTDKYGNPSSSSIFSVKRGQSLLYTIYKIWREMTLLENSLLLNRLTKSSILRLIQVEVGDMPKEDVLPHLTGIKQLFEQKSAINTGVSMQEYTNPGPIENNVYIPTYKGKGAISTQEIGGDTNVSGLADVDYFKTKLYSGLRIPKQYLGDTDDATGFNGGTALSLTSSRYAKTVKRIQNTLIQAITDAINLMLLDKGLDSYVNKFTIKMQSPTTQEEVDRRANEGTYINMIQDIMNLIDGTEIENASAKLTILKSLLSNIIPDVDVLQIIQDEIDKMESAEEEGVDTTDDELRAMSGSDEFNFDSDFTASATPSQDFNEMPNFEPPASNATNSEMNLPTPDELGAGDMVNFDNENA